MGGEEFERGEGRLLCRCLSWTGLRLDDDRGFCVWEGPRAIITNVKTTHSAMCVSYSVPGFVWFWNKIGLVAKLHALASLRALSRCWGLVSFVVGCFLNPRRGLSPPCVVTGWWWGNATETTFWRRRRHRC
jgi:hypothetical protein